MEIQITDFENAAFSVFLVLVTRAILSFDLNFYIPIKKVDENMERAHARDAVLDGKFYFRKDPFPARPSRSQSQVRGGGERSNGAGLDSPSTRPSTPVIPVEDEYEQMTIDEIMNGSSRGFPGLVPIVESYLDGVNVDITTRCELETYIDLVRKRASGELSTAASWIRDLVRAHPAYEFDSVVSDEIQKDLVAWVVAIGEQETAGEGLSVPGVPELSRLIGKFRCA